MFKKFKESLAEFEREKRKALDDFATIMQTLSLVKRERKQQYDAEIGQRALQILSDMLLTIERGDSQWAERLSLPEAEIKKKLKVFIDTSVKDVLDRYDSWRIDARVSGAVKEVMQDKTIIQAIVKELNKYQVKG